MANDNRDRIKIGKRKNFFVAIVKGALIKEYFGVLVLFPLLNLWSYSKDPVSNMLQLLEIKSEKIQKLKRSSYKKYQRQARQ